MHDGGHSAGGVKAVSVPLFCQGLQKAAHPHKHTCNSTQATCNRHRHRAQRQRRTETKRHEDTEAQRRNDIFTLAGATGRSLCVRAARARSPDGRA
eukprot:908554-Alexandrium_andersonii.AAC.1